MMGRLNHEQEQSACRQSSNPSWTSLKRLDTHLGGLKADQEPAAPV
jgi:hypothetical protein